MPSADPPLYEERLPVPWWIWTAALVLEATFAIGLGAPLGAWVGWATLLVTWVPTIWALRGATGRIRVVDGCLEVGRASLPLSVAGAATPLDAEAAARLRGRDADPRAYLWLKGWVPTAVRVDVVDPSDPTPYWYVSTRNPQGLISALERGRGT